MESVLHIRHPANSRHGVIVPTIPFRATWSVPGRPCTPKKTGREKSVRAGTHRHSRPPRTASERTRKSWPSDIFTTSAALGSSAIGAMMSGRAAWAHCISRARRAGAHARQTLPITARSGRFGSAYMLGSEKEVRTASEDVHGGGMRRRSNYRGPGCSAPLDRGRERDSRGVIVS